MSESLLLSGTSAVAIGGRALLIEGRPGSGKSSLALALIDRGAQLIGDDGVSLARRDGKVVAAPPPHIRGKLEIRGVGLVDLPPASAPAALILSLAAEMPRLPEDVGARELLGVKIPVLAMQIGAPAMAPRAEWALRLHGLPLQSE